MAKPQRPAIFKWRHFAPKVILCAVRWYLRHSLSIVMSRICWSNEAWRSTIRRPGDGSTLCTGTQGANSTASEGDQQNPGTWMRLTCESRAVGSTCIEPSIRRERRSISSSRRSSADAARRWFAKALADPSHPQPRVINTDKAKCYPTSD